MNEPSFDYEESTVPIRRSLNLKSIDPKLFAPPAEGTTKEMKKGYRQSLAARMLKKGKER